ncbi:MAG: hypothetical protein CHACPFDD_03616 [Phycisphaerae bacterium]|nr:hypothetical protein [Phycisphaerae bacterium]
MNPSSRGAAPTDMVLLHGGALGDLALAIQMCLSIKIGARPGREMTLLSRVSLHGLGDARPAIASLAADSAGVAWLYRTDDAPAPTALEQRIAGRIVVNALADDTHAVHARLMRLSPRWLLSFDPRPREPPLTHITDQWRRDLAAQGASFVSCLRQRYACRAIRPARPREPESNPSSVRSAERPPILVHPGSGGTAKCWPLAAFTAVADRLVEIGHRVEFLIGPVEAERWPPQALERIRREGRLIESFSSGVLVGALRRAALLLCNDAGPGHVAALLGVPVVSLFGPTRARRWRPLGPRCAALQGEVTTPDGRWGIKPDAVVERVRALLDTAPH